MADEEVRVEEEMDDIEVAELANQELRKKEAEIAKLKKDLAKAKLLSVADEEEKEPRSREECIKVLSDSRTSNYDYAEAVCELCEAEVAEGHEHPLGRDGEKVCDFFKECLDECGDDKNRFTAVYQAKLGADDPSIAMAYKKRK